MYSLCMAAIDWLKIEGFEFSDSEARDASDFSEIVGNLEMEPDAIFDLIRCEDLTVGRRLFFVNNVNEDNLAFMLLRDNDDRLCQMIKKKLESSRVKDQGGIIFA